MMRAAAVPAVTLFLLAALFPVPAMAGDATAPSAGAYILSTGKLRRGDPVPEFTAVDIYGVEVSLQGLLRSGKRPVLAFWSMYCKSCVEKFEALITLQAKYASQGLSVVSINTDGEYRRGTKEVRDFIADFERGHGMRVNFPVLYDERNWVAQAMNIEFLPTIVSVDRVGRVGGFYQTFGEGGEEAILAGLDALVREALALQPGGVGAGGPIGTGFGPGAPELGGLRIGDPVPRIRARGIFGTDVDIEGMISQRKKVVLVFWSIYCQSCVKKLKALAAVQERYGPQGVKIVSVNTDGEYGHGVDSVRSFVRNFEAENGVRLSFPVLYDEENPLPQALHIEFLPTIVTLDPDGRVLRIYQKFDESSDQAILAGVETVIREMLERFAAGAPAPRGEASAP
jgi:thiol-disulfide isomerase/thioredoxin